ncbi:hypothetical protein ACIQF6_14850 [Kitasatospora sp. NPDC092948]|uniref:hypothetical protein n=1 Tax=Kitasatospora sp. NPDC092948 TaxID=3364088 RepID=UPI0037FB9F4E
MTTTRLPDPEQGPDWYWMITGTWEYSGRTHTVTASDTMATYAGDTYSDLAERAMMAYQYKARASQTMVVQMLHLAPNTVISAASRS